MSTDFESQFEMPEAPPAPQRRGFFSQPETEMWIRRGTSFAIFVVSIFLVLFAFNILKEGILARTHFVKWRVLDRNSFANIEGSR